MVLFLYTRAIRAGRQNMFERRALAHLYAAQPSRDG